MADASAGSPRDPQQPTGGRTAFTCLILAAGRGERFGSATKQLAELDGEPLIAHAVRAASAAAATRIVVVVGHDGDRVAAAAAAAARSAAGRAGAGIPAATEPAGGARVGDGPSAGEHPGARPVELEVVVNPDHAAGQSTSLLAGLRALSADTADPIAVLLADQPRIDPRTITAVVAAVADGAEAARVRYLDAVAHPVAFAPSLVPRLRAVRGDRGAREVLRAIDTVEVAHEGPVPRDVDTPADLDALGQELRTPRPSSR
jgi:molybdenum cofactor cytidylyltransferase